MYSSQLLVPPPAQGGADTRTREQQDVWAASAPRIERMVPGFLQEALVPVPERRSESAPATAAGPGAGVGPASAGAPTAEGDETKEATETGATETETDKVADGEQ